MIPNEFQSDIGNVKCHENINKENHNDTDQNCEFDTMNVIM